MKPDGFVERTLLEIADGVVAAQRETLLCVAPGNAVG